SPSPRRSGKASAAWPGPRSAVARKRRQRIGPPSRCRRTVGSSHVRSVLRAGAGQFPPRVRPQCRPRVISLYLEGSRRRRCHRCPGRQAVAISWRGGADFRGVPDMATTTETTPAAANGAPEHKPYVPDEVRMPEFTWSAVTLGTLLGLVFAASSLYLVLKVGM